MKSACFLLKILTTGFIFATGFPFPVEAYDFSMLQGLKTKKEILMEMSGYDILAAGFKGSIKDEKIITSFKEKNKITDIQAEYAENQFDLPNLVIEIYEPEAHTDSFMVNRVYYLFQTARDSVYYFRFKTANQRDIALEAEIIDLFFKGKLDGYISKKSEDGEVNFAGQQIKTGNARYVVAPHHISCNEGQVRWSEFLTFEEAEMNTFNHIRSNQRDDAEILSDEDIEILFDDKFVTAQRTVYRFDSETYPLAFYYVTAEIGGKYLSCVMSHYCSIRNDYQRSPLLRQFFSIPSLPEWADSEYDIPEYEQYTEDEQENILSGYSGVDVTLQSIIPLGSLQNIFAFAPAIGMRVCFPVKNYGIIGVGVSGGFPVGTNNFKYMDFDDTKIRMIGSMDLQYTVFRYRLSGKLSLQPYFGMGYTVLVTDKIREYDDDENAVYYDTGAFDCKVGTGIIYDKLGLFFEYHKELFSNSSAITQKFGSRYLNFGIVYKYSLGSLSFF
ncbi:MAG: hypothetical protein LBC47_00270 [Tannerella sp.]|jgi:hypothetical protein|nr:hypothetical protein [Tannerella sp.]